MDSTPTLNAISKVPVTVSVTLAAVDVPIETILAWKPGATIVFPQRADAPLGIEIDGHPAGEGAAVARDRELGVRVESMRRDTGARDLSLTFDRRSS